MSRSRISRVEQEPLDPATSLKHWESIDLPEHSEYSSATLGSPYQDSLPLDFTPYQPYNTENYSQPRNGEPFSSPDVSPPLQSSSWERRGPPRVVSMVSPQSPDFPRVATSGPLGYSPMSVSGGPRLSTLVNQPSSHSPRPSTGLTTNRNSATYSIPPPPQPPSIPMEFRDVDSSYHDFKLSEHNRIDHEGSRSNRGSWNPGGLGAGLGAGLGRDKSMVRRISTRIVTAVRGRPKSGFSAVDAMIDEEAPTTTRSGYSKVDGEGDEANEPIGFDLDFFTVEHVPAAAVQAWQDHKMDADHLVYTGEYFCVKEGYSVANNSFFRNRRGH